MSEISVDPLRFLNIKKKRQNNKLRTDLKLPLLKQTSGQQASRFVLPSFSSQNSLENVDKNHAIKQYNALKYFNPEIEQYLHKLKQIKIANAPVMPAIKMQDYKSIGLQSNALNKNNENKGYINFMNTFKNVDNQNQMMTFAKGGQNHKPKQMFSKLQVQSGDGFYSCNEIKSLGSYSLNRPGLKKSGSFKMMQKLQQDGQVINRVGNQEMNGGVSAWELPENVQENSELKECEICSRKFNPKSYEKHVKVCQKVFFQKRKPFNSRQNSLSKKTK